MEHSHEVRSSAPVGTFSFESGYLLRFDRQRFGVIWRDGLSCYARVLFLIWLLERFGSEVTCPSDLTLGSLNATDFVLVLKFTVLCLLPSIVSRRMPDEMDRDESTSRARLEVLWKH